MSFQAITTFFRQVDQSSDLKQAVETALQDRPLAAAFEIVDIAKSNGCDFTATELREFLAADSSGVELSEEQLEAVSGGLLLVRSLDLIRIRKIGSLSLDQIEARRMGRI